MFIARLQIQSLQASHPYKHWNKLLTYFYLIYNKDRDLRWILEAMLDWFIKDSEIFANAHSDS